jgi:hypothetical protein
MSRLWGNRRAGREAEIAAEEMAKQAREAANRLSGNVPSTKQCPTV